MPVQPESQEEILAAGEASLTGEDIPPEDEAYGWPDPDTGPPVELLEVTDQELDELLRGTPARPAPPEWPLGCRVGVAAGRVSGAGPAGWPLSYLGCAGAGSPDGFLAGEGLGRGFAEGGVLDELPASIVLAEFADDACRRVEALDDNSLIGVLRAWRRLASWASARELAMVAEVARRRPADGTPPAAAPGQFPAQISEFAADEVGLALTLTSSAARTEMELALDVVSRPAIGAALESGRIDLAKARILISMICPLEPEHADAVEAAVLPKAGDLTTGGLRAALQRAILRVDPDAARRRRDEAQKDARVDHWTDPEGTATLAGRYLPPAEVLAADKRLGAIATAWKKQGAQGGMDRLRSHVYLALLLGQPIDAPPPGLCASAGPQGKPGPASGIPLPPLTGEVNVTIPLTTLLGLADRPGEAAGYGPLHADTVRTLVDAMAGHRSTRWGVIVTSQDGRAMGYGGGVRARPVSAGGWKITLTTQPIAPYP